MKALKNKIAAITISIFFILSMTALLTLIPSASAHNPAWNIPTYAYINVAPNPTGLGQTIIVYMWLDCVYGQSGTGSAALTNNYRFSNYELAITAPDGTKTTQTWASVSDPTSSQLLDFTPTQVGTYIFNFTYPGQAYGANGDGSSSSIYVNDTYLSSAASATLTVQQAPIPAAVGSSPLPTAYWQSPVYGENSNWYTITSNWLGCTMPTAGGTSSGQPNLEGYTSTVLYSDDGVGPLTSHIMWTRPLQFGGVVGGDLFAAGGSNPNGADLGAMYFEGSSYEPRFTDPIIIDGYLYYTEPISFTGGTAGPTVCVCLQTGQVLWSSTVVPQLSFGYIYNVWDPNQHGTFPPILFTASFARAFDAYTGDPMFNVTNVPSGTEVQGPDGEQLRYVITNDGTTANPAWYLAEWNSTKLWQWTTSDVPTQVNASEVGTDGVPESTTGGTPPAIPAQITNTNGGVSNSYVVTADDTNPSSVYYNFDWNISLPWLDVMGNQTVSTVTLSNDTVVVEKGYSSTGSNPDASNPSTVIASDYNDVMLCRNGSLPSGFAATDSGSSSQPYTMFAVNLNATVGLVGSILWMQTYPPPAGNITLQDCDVDFQTRVFVYNYYETMQWVGYSLKTGDMLWGPTPSEVTFNYYDWAGYDLGVMAYGNLYNGGFGGVTYCFNDSTGALKWTWGNGPAGSSNSTNAGLNTPYGDYPTFIQVIADGVVYLSAEEHTIPNPLYKGATAEAINATTGQEIWKLSEYDSTWATSGSEWAVADGYATFMNGYDNNVYSVGRGPSATTVTAPDAGLAYGQPAVIRGTVMDVSAGTQQSEQEADFPNGVPCCSDATMTAWMGYVYQQQPMPTNFTGVTVQLYVLDSNGNYHSIGSATTNDNGVYSLTWTPNIPGNFTVYADFAGTNGYWPSTDSTTFAVMQPTATAPPYPTPVSGLASTWTVELGVAALAIVIVIIGAILAVLTLRKRP